MRIVFSSQLDFKTFTTRNHPVCPQRRSSLHNDLCVDLLESMLACAFFLIPHNTVHISINNFIFKHLSAKKLHIFKKGTTFNKIREI